MKDQKDKDIDVIYSGTRKRSEEVEIEDTDSKENRTPRRNTKNTKKTGIKSSKGKKTDENGKKPKKSKKTKIKIAVLVAEILTVLVLSFAIVLLVMPNSKAWLLKTPIGKFFMKAAFSEEAYKNMVDDEYDRNDVGINDDLDTSKLDDYLNIAFFGLDSRHGFDEASRSDVMIIVSINKESKEVRMASVFRDTYLRNFNADGEQFYDRANTSYFFGRGNAAVKMLNTNLDLNIKDYVTVNFDGIADIVDLVGGIEVNLTKEEAGYVNGYIDSYYQEIKQYDKMGTHHVEVKSGPVTLDGVQTTAFCRVRYAIFTDEYGNTYHSDFGRAARQRYVISRILDKAKLMGVDKVMELAEKVLVEDQNIFLTSIPYEDILDLIPMVLEMSIKETKGYPMKYITYNEPNKQMVMADNLAQMVVDLHAYLFDDDDYTPSKTVLEINEILCSKGGLSTEYTSGKNNK